MVNKLPKFGQNISRIAGPVEVLDFKTQVQLGNVTGWAIMRALGERQNMGITISGEDIWRGNEFSAVPAAPASHTTIPTPADAGEQMTVISESDADNGATATGILTIRLHYLDANGNPQTEDITMNGIAAVNTVATDIRFVQDMHALTVGSNGSAEGNIRIYKTTDDTLVYSMIGVGSNRAIVPLKMVPKDKIFVSNAWHVTEANNKRCAFRILSTDFLGGLLPGVFSINDVAFINGGASAEMLLDFVSPAFAIIKVSGTAVAINASASCQWWGYLVDV